MDYSYWFETIHLGWFTVYMKRSQVIFQIKLNNIEPQHKISNNVVCVTSKDSDQTTRSLIRAFASRLNIYDCLPNIIRSFEA